ncbi:hypothetical protein HH310_23670 [Actinoplanes sp. TBRC 11911]|uniref:hypothetical protein n=1 Tax=Actinoplanes sp. TBRC 11911 TaxID=2729386 RepID=UPI00145DCB29|nr:hypothetical protein [Actinoplanes sp. TBRC 11911]NMO54169.1 hypothetical protein [Actinoplanes sp. TBRC 11911]
MPLLIVLGALILPMFCCTLYVRGRRVDTTPRTWGAKRLTLSVLGSLPLVVFALGASYQNSAHFVWANSLIGAVIGGLIGGFVTARRSKQRRRAEAAAELADVD